MNHGLRNFNDMKVLIRQALKEDLQAIYSFINELEETLFDEAIFRTHYYHNLLQPHVHYLIAEDVGRPIGFISCQGQILLHHNGLVYEIQELFVAKEYRSKGIGAQLIKALEERIAPDDYKLLEVACNVKRKDTHRFYLVNGFRQTHYKFTKEK